MGDRLEGLSLGSYEAHEAGLRFRVRYTTILTDDQCQYICSDEIAGSK